MQWSRALFWFIFFILTYLFVAPQQYLPPKIFDWWDKLQHVLAFGVLTTLGFLAYGINRIEVSRVVLGLVVYGACIEVFQSLSGWRHGDLVDWLADLIGVTMAWGVFHYLKNRPYLVNFWAKIRKIP